MKLSPSFSSFGTPCVDEAITAVETTKERWRTAETDRMAGEITLMGAWPDTAKEQTLDVARKQQRDPGAARADELDAILARSRQVRGCTRMLAPIYGWFGHWVERGPATLIGSIGRE